MGAKLPTVFRKNGYRIFFYSADRLEPKHVHVEKSGSVAKFWLRPFRASYNYGMSAKEFNQARSLVRTHQFLIERKWDEFFGK